MLRLWPSVSKKRVRVGMVSGVEWFRKESLDIKKIKIEMKITFPFNGLFQVSKRTL